MNRLKSLLTAGLVVSVGFTMAQTAESSEKKPVAKPPATVTTVKKETKSPTGSATGKTGTYQKAEKHTATGSTSKTGKKPKTRKERLEMEAAARARTQPGTQGTTFEPGADGFVEVTRNDLQTLVDRMGEGRLKIKSFTLVYTQNGVTKELRNSTREITPEVRQAVDRFAVGQTFSIEDAKGVTREGREIAVPVTRFRIKQGNETAPEALQKKK